MAGTRGAIANEKQTQVANKKITTTKSERFHLVACAQTQILSNRPQCKYGSAQSAHPLGRADIDSCRGGDSGWRNNDNISECLDDSSNPGKGLGCHGL